MSTIKSPSICLIACLWLSLMFGITPSVNAQLSGPREYRSEAIYHADGETLKQKYQYYYDFWFERKVKHGRSTKWSKKGVIRCDAYYAEDQLAGPQMRYSRRGKKRRLSNWQDGRKHGPFQRFDRQERLRKELNYDEGMRSGIRKKWYRNGQLKSAVVFQNGIRQGKVQRYRRNGRAKQNKAASAVSNFLQQTASTLTQ